MTDQEQAASPSGDREDLAIKLAGITGAISIIASGSRDDGGPLLWDALAYLSNELVDVTEAVTSILVPEIGE
jgi:hypothetical protein